MEGVGSRVGRLKVKGIEGEGEKGWMMWINWMEGEEG